MLVVPANVRLVNVATPLTAATVVVPPMVPDPAETEIDAVDDSTTRSFASRTLTTGWVASVAPAPAPTGCVVTLSFVAVPVTLNTRAVDDVWVSVAPSSDVTAVARILYLPAASAPVVHDHAPVVEFAVHVDPVSVHVPDDELVSASLERVANESWIDAPTGADPESVSVEFDVMLSLLDEPLSEAASRSGTDTEGSA